MFSCKVFGTGVSLWALEVGFAGDPTSLAGDTIILTEDSIIVKYDSQGATLIPPYSSLSL